jgi:hypothetical protein
VHSAVPTRERSTSAESDVPVSDRLLSPSVASSARLQPPGVVRMTGSVIAPIVPGSGLRGEKRRAPASLPTPRRQPPIPLVMVPTPREGSTVYGMTALDRHGRLADRVVLRALGWVAGTRLVIGGTRELVTLQATGAGNTSGVSYVTAQGYLRLPAPRPPRRHDAGVGRMTIRRAHRCVSGRRCGSGVCWRGSGCWVRCGSIARSMFSSPAPIELGETERVAMWSAIPRLRGCRGG